MDQLNLLISTLYRLRSLVTGVQKAAVLLMIISGFGSLSIGLGLLILGAPWWFTWFSFVLFGLPAGLLWWWKARLNPTAEMLGSAHSALLGDNPIDDLSKTLGQGREWVTEEVGKLGAELTSSGNNNEPSSWLAAISPVRLGKSALQIRSASRTVKDSFIGQITSTVAVLNFGTLTVVGFLAAAAIASAGIGAFMLTFALLASFV